MKKVEEYNYIEKPVDKLKSNFNERKRKGLNGFDSFEHFLDWYNSQSKECFYCGIKEAEVQKIAVLGKLTSNRFPQNGILKRGQSRGMWLEVDKLNPKSNYSTNNSVLCCYFCNNDKSDVFHGLDYKKFFQNRAEFLRELLIK